MIKVTQFSLLNHLFLKFYFLKVCKARSVCETFSMLNVFTCTHLQIFPRLFSIRHSVGIQTSSVTRCHNCITGYTWSFSHTPTAPTKLACITGTVIMLLLIQCLGSPACNPDLHASTGSRELCELSWSGGRGCRDHLLLSPLIPFCHSLACQVCEKERAPDSSPPDRFALS